TVNADEECQTRTGYGRVATSSNYRGQLVPADQLTHTIARVRVTAMRLTEHNGSDSILLQGGSQSLAFVAFHHAGHYQLVAIHGYVHRCHGRGSRESCYQEQTQRPAHRRHTRPTAAGTYRITIP